MKILVIEDNPDHADLLMDCLQQAFHGQADITWYTELLPALEFLRRPARHNYSEICFCDLQLPDSDIQTTTEYLSRLDSPVPIVVLTSLHDADKARALIQSGVQDYIAKEDLGNSDLYKTCVYAIERQRQTVELEEKNRDLAAFCQSLSHDFKEPIHQVRNDLDQLIADLSQRFEPTTVEQTRFQSLKHNISLVETLVDDLYQYLILDNKQEEFTMVDLNAVVAEARSLLTTDKDLTNLTIAELPTIEGFQSQLVILFKNLLDNSVKFCHGDPIIQLRTEAPMDDQYVVISVRDNGIGVDADNIAKLFIPFERAHDNGFASGSGLGLSMAKRIVDKHRGYIHFDSAPDIGTTVMITLPYHR